MPASSHASSELSTASLIVVRRAFDGLSKPRRWRFFAKNSETEISRCFWASDSAVARGSRGAGGGAAGSGSSTAVAAPLAGEAAAGSGLDAKTVPAGFGAGGRAAGLLGAGVGVSGRAATGRAGFPPFAASPNRSICARPVLPGLVFAVSVFAKPSPSSFLRPREFSTGCPGLFTTRSVSVVVKSPECGFPPSHGSGRLVFLAPVPAPSLPRSVSFLIRPEPFRFGKAPTKASTKAQALRLRSVRHFPG